MKTYIISEHRRDLNCTFYVVARPGWMRCSNGTYARDGSFAGGPEWSRKREHAYVFHSHRSAARVQSKSPSSTIIPL